MAEAIVCFKNPRYRPEALWGPNPDRECGAVGGDAGQVRRFPERQLHAGQQRGTPHPRRVVPDQEAPHTATACTPLRRRPSWPTTSGPAPLRRRLPLHAAAAGARTPPSSTITERARLRNRLSTGSVPTRPAHPAAGERPPDDRLTAQNALHHWQRDRDRRPPRRRALAKLPANEQKV